MSRQKRRRAQLDGRSKRARKIRVASEFDVVRLQTLLRTPLPSMSEGSWTLAEVVSARDQQMRGMFAAPSRLAKAMRTDDALFVAYENRLAPQRAITHELRGRDARVLGEANALYGPAGVALGPDTRADINGTLANHGVAFAVLQLVVREGGARSDLYVRHFPIEFVRWSVTDRCFMAQVESIPEAERVAIDPSWRHMSEVPIVNGDGRWVVFAKHEDQPWSHEACILPGALIWARHATALRDWVKGSTSHGNAKVIGEMNPGVALTDSAGNPTREAMTFLELLRSMASLDSPYGLKPSGSKVEYITNSSKAWEVWERLTIGAEKSAARVYLGTDGTLGAAGGAPGVDIQALFGVATTRVQGDLSCIERGVNTGILEPWAAMNFGSSAAAPHMTYLVPDPDASARRADYAASSQAFWTDVQAHRENGFVLTQEHVNSLASSYGVAPPTLKPVAPAVTA